MNDAHAHHVETAATGMSETGIPAVDFFAGGGEYMPRVHCMTDEAGNPDLFWIILLVVLNITVIAGYLKIFRFWRRAYMETEARDRNEKMMDLAWIFLWCATCGYIASVVMFFWPGYRLVAFALMPLAFFTWKFASNLEPFRISLSARRLERELQEALERRNDELEREVAARTRELEEARIRSEQASQAKSRFVANISHEIRTPMNAIAGFTDLLDEDREDPEAHRTHVETVRRNTEHLIRLVSDVLDVSKIEASLLDVESILVDTRQLMKDIRDTFSARAKASDLALTLSIDDGVPRVITSDPTRLRQIISNLVGNAIKFTEQGYVAIRVRHADGELTVEVADSGIGMDEDTRSKLFGAFVQADASTTREFGGTGLGLKISRDLARLMGGDITVSSTPNEGSVFTCVVDAPAADTAEAAPHAGPEAGPVAYGADALAGRTILLAEDGDDNAQLARLFLMRCGAEVLRARDGGEAVKIATEREDLDLILMDMQMPVLDGLGAAREILASGSSTPIIAVTANAMSDDRKRCREAGCVGFVAKPYRRGELIAACVKALEGSARRDAA